ncbi:MAG: hypothetical protein A4S09_11510 [Proteobacteria bacterium SG_bin7]|nr:MAG: hypothetical protein A4S09_11510 [Proteobacteria bacterium SG_bin7]
MSIKPFISVVLVILTLFSLVFMKMDIRRLSYSVLQLAQKEKLMKDRYRYRSLKLAQVMRTERIKSYAQTYLALNEAQRGQIIHMTGDRIALKQ